MGNPSIIFGDEPTGALNSSAAQEIMELLSGIHREGTAIMLVTHDIRVAAQTQRIFFLLDGRLVSELRLPEYDGTGLEERMKQVMEKAGQVGI